MNKLKPIFTLIAISMVMPELTTGSTNLFGFLNPVTLIVLFLGYGIAVLLIREFSIRHNLNFFGLFIIGFAYLILNEGLIAKTIIIESGIPFDVYSNYGYIFGISVPWSLAMGLWHSVYSVIFPITVVHFLFPEVSKEAWLSKKMAFILLPIPLALGIFSFFGPIRGVGTVGQFVILIGSMIVFTIAAWLFGRKTQSDQSITPQTNLKPVWLGVSTFFFVTVLLSFVIAGLKMPLFVFFAVFILGIIFYVRILKKKIGINNDTLLLFILGAYFETAITGLLIAIFFSPATLIERLIAETIIIVISIMLVGRVFQKNRAIPS